MKRRPGCVCHTGGAISVPDLREESRFKAVNDTHGHQAGDELPIAVAQRLGAVLRPGNEVSITASIGIAFAGHGIYTPEQLIRHADLAMPRRVRAGVSVSGAEVDIDTMLNNADPALYQAKRDGRDRTITYRPHADRRHEPAAAGMAQQEPLSRSKPSKAVPRGELSGLVLNADVHFG
jgi:predicted signal transduction protein with EAL and GGDEF domain